MNQKANELKAGIFAVAGAALFASALLLLGGGTNLFARQQVYFAHFNSLSDTTRSSPVCINLT